MLFNSVRMNKSKTVCSELLSRLFSFNLFVSLVTGNLTTVIYNGISLHIQFQLLWSFDPSYFPRFFFLISSHKYFASAFNNWHVHYDESRYDANDC